MTEHEEILAEMIAEQDRLTADAKLNECPRCKGEGRHKFHEARYWANGERRWYYPCNSCESTGLKDYEPRDCPLFD